MNVDKEFSMKSILSFILVILIYEFTYGQNFDNKSGITAASVIEKYISAIGGRDKLEDMTDRKTILSGTVQEMPVNIVIYQKAPDKFRQDISSGTVGQKIIYNGSDAFQLSAMGRQEITGEMLIDLKADANFNAILDLEKAGIESTFADTENVNGKDTYKLEMKFKNGKKWFEFYDVESGMKLRQMKTISTASGRVTQLTDFSDYREVDGIKYPFSLTQSVGSQEIKMEVQSIEVNSGLDDNLFNIYEIE